MRHATRTLLLLWSSVALILGSKMDARKALVRDAYEIMKRECAVERDLSPGEADFDDPETKEQKCLVACVLERSGIFNGGAFSRSGTDLITEFVYQDEPELKTRARDVSVKCDKQLAREKNTDECEEAVRAILCLRRELKSLRFKYWN